MVAYVTLHNYKVCRWNFPNESGVPLPIVEVSLFTQRTCGYVVENITVSILDSNMLPNVFFNVHHLIFRAATLTN